MRTWHLDFFGSGRRVLKHLGIAKESVAEKLPPDSVLVARQLLPSETFNLDCSPVVAIVTEVDGQTGSVVVSPSKNSCTVFSRYKRKYEQVLAKARTTKKQKCVTEDGGTVHLLANTGGGAAEGSSSNHKDARSRGRQNAPIPEAGFRDGVPGRAFFSRRTRRIVTMQGSASFFQVWNLVVRSLPRFSSTTPTITARAPTY